MNRPRYSSHQTAESLADVSIDELLDYAVGIVLPTMKHRHGSVMCSCQHHRWNSYTAWLDAYRRIRTAYLATMTSAIRDRDFVEVLFRAASRWPDRIEALGLALHQRRQGARRRRRRRR